MEKVKLKLVDRAIIVKVVLSLANGNEKAEIPMLLDTGAKFSLIDKNALESFGYTLKNASDITFKGVGKEKLLGKKIKVKSMQLHKLKRQNFEIVAYDFPMITTMHYQGILGLDFFLKQNFTINLKNKEFHFN